MENNGILNYTISISCGWRLNEGIHEAKKD